MRTFQRPAVLRRVSQGHGFRAAQGGNRRSQNRGMVWLQTFWDHRVLRWLARQIAVGSGKSFTFADSFANSGFLYGQILEFSDHADRRGAVFRPWIDCVVADRPEKSAEGQVIGQPEKRAGSGHSSPAVLSSVFSMVFGSSVAGVASSISSVLTVMSSARGLSKESIVQFDTR